MTRIKRLRNIILVGSVAYLVIALLMLNYWEQSWLTTIVLDGGMVLLAIGCVVYFYGFLFWKD